MRLLSARLIAVLCLFPVFASGEIVTAGFGYISHIADGGGNQMDITLSNLDDTPSGYTVIFYADSGALLSLVTDAGTGTTVSGSLAPHASRTIHTSGVGATVTQGWAAIQTTGTIGASAIFHVNTPPWTGSEAMIPMDTSKSYRFSMVFDHTGSDVTGLALVNPFPSTPIAVTLTFLDENAGVLGSDSFTMAGFSHRSLVVTQSYPATLARRGSIEISTSGSYMGVLGLRFGASAISSVLPLVSSQWGASVTPPPDPYTYYYSMPNLP